MKITDEMIAAFKRAAFDRLMHEDGCPDGEQIRAGLEAVAPMIAAEARDDALEEAAEQAEIRADEYQSTVQTILGTTLKFKSIPAVTAVSDKAGSAQAIADAIRTLKTEGAE